MEKRVIEKMMFGTLLLFTIMLPVGFYYHIPMMTGSALTLGVISMICWFELDWIDSRQRRLERKYGKSK